MAVAFSVSTKFSAVDAFTAKARVMTSAVSKFGNMTQVAMARASRAARKFQGRITTLNSKIFNLKNAMAVGVAALFAKKLFDVAAGTAKVGDEAAKTSRIIGMSAENLQEMRFAADRQGVANGALDKSLIKLNRNIGDVQLGQGTLTTILKKTNPALLAQLKNVEDNDQAFALMTKAISEAPNQLQKTALAQAAFGKSGTDMLKLLEVGPEGIAKLREEARKYGGVISNEAAAASEEFVDAQTNMNFAISGLTTSLGVKLMPQVQSYIENITEWIGSNKELINTKIDAFINKVSDTIGFLIDNGSAILTTFKWLIGTFIVLNALMLISKGFLIAVSVVTWLYNVAVGVQAAVLGSASIAMAGNTTAIIAMNFATTAITATTWLWNAALAANPIVWIIIAIAALIAIIILLAMNWDVVMKVMKLAWEGFKLSFTLIGLKIKNGFLNMIDAIVMAWKWGQNKMGFLSDEKFAKDKARIESEKQARIAAIKETESAIAKNIAETKAAASEFSFTGSNGEETENQDGAPGEPGTPATPVNPDLARIERTEQVEKQNVNITIDDKTGKATVDADKGIPVNSTSTMVPG